MSVNFEAECSKCGERFEVSPGRLNSTEFLGETSKNIYLPKCPKCGNFRDNCLISDDGTLEEPMRF